jgi:hypothetical protein
LTLTQRSKKTLGSQETYKKILKIFQKIFDSDFHFRICIETYHIGTTIIQFWTRFKQSKFHQTEEKLAIRITGSIITGLMINTIQSSHQVHTVSQEGLPV